MQKQPLSYFGLRLISAGFKASSFKILQGQKFAVLLVKTQLKSSFFPLFLPLPSVSLTHSRPEPSPLSLSTEKTEYTNANEVMAEVLSGSHYVPGFIAASRTVAKSLLPAFPFH